MHGDGHPIPVEISAKVIEINGKKSDIVVMHDNTQRDKMEQALRESEARYRLLADNSNDVIWTMSLDGHFTYVSPAVFQLRGYTVEEVSNQRLEEVVCPSSLPLIKRELEFALREGQMGIQSGIRYYEIEQPCKNGSSVWTEATANLLYDSNNQPVGVVGVSRNITERKKVEKELRESERRLSEIIEFLPDATMVINLKNEVVAWNRAMEDMTGVKACDILGRGDHEYALPFYGERCSMLIDLLIKPEDAVEKRYVAIERNGDTISGEAFMPHLRGGGVYLFGTASILRSCTGEVIGAIESIRDITERKKSEDLIKTSLKEKETLLKEIQHRVKNNMQVVSSLLELQSNFVKDQEDAHLFRESQDRIKAMSLVYSKLYKSKDLANISVKEYLTELVENLLFSYNLGSNKVDTTIDIDNISLGLDLVIPCGLIVNEIVVNSLKYAFKDGREGLISLAIHKIANDDIEMDIADNGVGILGGVVDVNAGSTLGMELVYALAEQQLGGRVEVSRTRGMAFKIIFNAGKSLR